MSDEPIVDWESIIHKNVRTSDGEGAGNVVAIDNEGLHIESAGDRVHAVVPKSAVSGFNGAEVLLNKTFAEVWQYVRR